MSANAQDDRVIVWFDIDNTLYSASSKISQAMGERIHAYFVKLGLSHEEASELHHQYYTQYGLALRGLTRHHDVDPLDFDRQCDGSLPLEEMIKYDPNLVRLFEDIDRTKARVWALTNAYRPHAERVLHILRLEHLIDGLFYCDYQTKNLVCKPEPEYYVQAMQLAGVTDPSKCYFVDDSLQNVMAARALGWSHCVHFCERGLEMMEGGKLKKLNDEVSNGSVPGDIEELSDLQQLRKTMEFKPRYIQPFTVAQAVGFDVSVITEEIARLQNSVTHLKDTQVLLQSHLANEGDDAELTAALAENEGVIAGQQERISMLQFALREKGINMTEHYTLPSPPVLTQDLPRTEVNQPLVSETDNEDGGIDL